MANTPLSFALKTLRKIFLFIVLPCIATPLVVVLALNIGDYTNKADRPTKITEHNFTQADVCRAGLAADLGLSLHQVQIEQNSRTSKLLSNSGYSYECYTDNSNIIWRSLPSGRWRVNYEHGDSRIYWEASGMSINIKIWYSDNSRRTRKYTFKSSKEIL